MCAVIMSEGGVLLLLLLVKDGTYLANGRRPARKHGSAVCHWPPCDENRSSNLLEFFQPRRQSPRASLRKKGSTQMNVQSSPGRTDLAHKDTTSFFCDPPLPVDCKQERSREKIKINIFFLPLLFS
jgi:hypothetical protein